jgi:hypothetical protein
MRRTTALGLSALLALTFTATATTSAAEGEPASTVEPAAASAPSVASTPGAENAAAAPAPATGTAHPAIPRNRLYLADLTLIRYNPLGLETQNRLVFQHRLMDSESTLFRDTFASGAISLKLNPAYLKVGPIVELQPVAVLNLRAGYEFVKYFGGFGYLQSYADPSQDYSDAARAAGEEAGLNYATAGHHVFFEPTLQAKVKKIAVRSKLAIESWNVSLRDGDTVFYDATLDTLVPAKGMVIANDTDLLYVSGKALTVGLRFSGVWPKYSETERVGGAAGSGFEPPSHQRLGPILAWSFNGRDYSSFNKPTLLVITGWYLNHANRGGALPYILVGFSFTSDLLK